MCPDPPELRIDRYDEGLSPPDNFTGLWEYYWPNEQLKFRASYINGKEHGEVTCWWENGRLAQIGRREFGICRGIWSDYWNDGSKSLETDYLDNDNFIKRWYANGAMVRSEEWRNGQLVNVDE